MAVAHRLGRAGGFDSDGTAEAGTAMRIGHVGSPEDFAAAGLS